MNGKFQNKYRISSARLKNWDYGQNGAYFITICAGNRKHFFGKIISVDGENKIQLNEIGKLANDFWLKIPEHFSFVELGNFVVMPNHIHGILIIDKINVVDAVETLQCNVSAHNGKMSHTTIHDEKTLQLQCNIPINNDSIHEKRRCSATSLPKTNT